jgi:hypothetical protein
MRATRLNSLNFIALIVFSIPLEAWISVCVFSVFVLSYVQVASLRRADPPFEESYRLSVD